VLLLGTLLIPYSRMMMEEREGVGRRDVIIIIIIIMISSWLLINLLKWLKVDDRM